MSQPRIALGMIVKHDELDMLTNALNSVMSYIDYAYISVNYKKGEDATKIEQKVLKYSKNWKQVDFDISEWTNFGDARNRNMQFIADRNYDFYFWMDVDDIVENADKLRQVAAAATPMTSGIYMPYDYQHDQFGNVTVQHYVARLVRNDGSYRWSDKLLHESLEPVRGCGKAINQEVHVVHQADDLRRDQSLIRNIEMLEKELEREGDRQDPRTLFYLGSAYIDSGDNENAKTLLTKYLQLSGWAEERAQAWVHLGNIFDNEDNLDEARRCYLHALAENPKDPTACLELGKIEMLSEMHEKAVEWIEMALAKKVDPMTTVNYGLETTYRAHMYLSDCFMSMGGDNIDKALEHAQKALELRPDETTQEYYQGIQDVIDYRSMTKGVVLALRELEKQTNQQSTSHSESQLLTLLQSLPESLQDNPAILRYKRRHMPPKKWEKGSIVIFVGNSVLGDWGPWSLESGIGGSEEAVVRLSRELVKKGHPVTVYSTPGLKAGVYDGVEYKNYWELNLADTFDTFVAWRMPAFFDVKVNARNKYLWLHDVMDKEEFTEKRIANLDKVIVLSKYHRTLYPMVPDDKIFLSANGITPEDFEAVDGKFERDPHRVIYMSSHVRGLQMLYDVWDEVLQEVPDATLDVYYGWNSYDAVNKDNPERMAWKEKMVNREKELKGVTDHGRVGHQVIVEEIAKSGVWAYPCTFPEISCITAMKALSGGAWPVCSNFAALDETVQFGEKLKIEMVDKDTPVGQWGDAETRKFKDMLVHILKNPPTNEQRQEMMKWSRENQSWSKVADSWIGEFK